MKNSLDLPQSAIFGFLNYENNSDISSIVYEGIGAVSIHLFFLWKVFIHTKKHKKQTSNFYSDILGA